MADLRKKCKESFKAFNVEKTRRIEAGKLSQQRKAECDGSLEALQNEREMSEARYTNMESELAECKKKLMCAEEQTSLEAESADREKINTMEKISKVEQSSESPGAGPENSSEILALQRYDRGKVSKMKTNEKPVEQNSAVSGTFYLAWDATFQEEAREREREVHEQKS